MATAPKTSSKNAPQDDSNEGKPKKSKKKLILVAVLALVLLGGGGGAAWFFMGHNAEKSAKVEKPSPPVFVTMEQFTVNLQPEGGEHYLQVAMTLQVANKEDVELLKLFMPQVRDRILRLLANKKATEISTEAGKSKLSEEIVAKLNEPFGTDGKKQSVTQVFFTSFIIQ